MEEPESFILNDKEKKKDDYQGDESSRIDLKDDLTAKENGKGADLENHALHHNSQEQLEREVELAEEVTKKETPMIDTMKPLGPLSEKHSAKDSKTKIKRKISLTKPSKPK